jgi:hypothetical protein
LVKKWLDFNDFIDNALENASSDTGYLKTWYDQSGNSYDLAQATAANQPIFDKVNNLFVFNGTDKFLQRTQLSEVSESKAFSIFVTATPASVSTAQVLINNILGASDKFSLSFESGILRATIYDGSNISKSGVITADKFSALITYDGNGGLNLYIDGILQSGTANAILGDVNALTIGAKSASTKTNFYNGKLQNVIIFGKVINEIERNIINLFSEQF